MINLSTAIYQKLTQDKTSVFLSLLLAFTMAGIEFGRIGRDSFFINTVGAKFIPYMYIADGVLMVFASIILSYVARKMEPAKLSTWLYLLAAPLALLLWLSMLFSRESAFLPYIIFSIFDIILLLLILGFWGLASHSFSAKEGKKKFPVIGSCGLLGTCLGALLANQLISLLGVEVLFLYF